MTLFKIGDKVEVKANSRYKNERAFGVGIIARISKEEGEGILVKYSNHNDLLQYGEDDLQLIEKKVVKEFGIVKFLREVEKGGK